MNPTRLINETLCSVHAMGEERASLRPKLKWSNLFWHWQVRREVNTEQCISRSTTADWFCIFCSRAQNLEWTPYTRIFLTIKNPYPYDSYSPEWVGLQRIGVAFVFCSRNFDLRLRKFYADGLINDLVFVYYATFNDKL